jgi:hypothetical protein
VYGSGSGAWIWKDPRNCITLPFWEDTLGIEPVVLLVHRNPLAVADSLHARDDLSRTISLALWERYVRDSLANVGGHRVLCASSDEILDDARGWVARVRDVVTGAGIELDPEPGAAAVTDAVEVGLQHSSYGAGDVRTDGAVSEAQRELFDVLAKLSGAHDHLVVPELPAPTGGTDLLLTEHARFYEEREALREKLARAREYDQRILNVRRLKVRTYALYRRLRRHRA